MPARGRSIGSKIPAYAVPDLEFDLPHDRIALHPETRREKSRLFVYARKSRGIVHSTFDEIETWLRPGDLLVFNTARVEACRIPWRKPSNGRAELLLLRDEEDGEHSSVWSALLSGKNLSIGREYSLPGGGSFSILVRTGDGGMATVRMRGSVGEVRAWMREFGELPLPPYIRRERLRRGEKESIAEDRIRYQTVLAETPGAVAAPTAALHFSSDLIKRLEGKGVQVGRLHLSVGYGTFQALTEEHWSSGRLHPEWAEISGTLVDQIERVRRSGGRVIAVGTTVVRALEWWRRDGGKREGKSGWCDLFLKPDWSTDLVDAMVTNFHLPGSSLLALVAGFLGDDGVERVMTLYKEAIQERYRFYSYGDAMLIL